MINSHEFLNMYLKLSQDQKERIFTKEQKEIIEKEISFIKMLERPDFYKAVRDTIAEEVYNELRNS